MRVGLIVGREQAFPDAFIAHFNEKHGDRVRAEMVSLTATSMDAPVPYRVILDRISHEVPFYRAYLGKAVVEGAVVINNPFWWSADDKFFECVLASRLGVAVPKTVLVPNRAYAADIIDASLRNLVQPPSWADMLAYTGLPAVLKPAIGGGSKSISVVRSLPELQEAWERSGALQMVLQEFIEHENYVRCFVIGRQHVSVSRFDISKPRNERYSPDHQLSPSLLGRVTEDCLTLARALGYDMDTIEWAIRDGIPYAIDFLNPAPDCEPAAIRESFPWVLERLSQLIVEYAMDESASTAEPTWPHMLSSSMGSR